MPAFRGCAAGLAGNSRIVTLTLGTGVRRSRSSTRPVTRPMPGGISCSPNGWKGGQITPPVAAPRWARAAASASATRQTTRIGSAKRRDRTVGSEPRIT